MPKIHCSIDVAVTHDDTPKAAIKVNTPVLGLIRNAQKLGDTEFVTRSVNGGRPEPAGHAADPRNLAAVTDSDFAEVAQDPGDLAG